MDSAKEIREKCIKDFIDVIVLAAMNSNPMCGYDVIALIYEKFQLLPSSGKIYPLLWSLEKQGLIESKWTQSKKIYSLTAKGKERIKTMLNEYARVYQSIFALLEREGAPFLGAKKINFEQNQIHLAT